MAYKKLTSGDLQQMPLILAGPILRRVTKNSVTVWVALRAASNVTLYVKAPGDGFDKAIIKGSAITKQIGANLFVIAVTAKPAEGSPSCLIPGAIYDYELKFNGAMSGGLGDAGIFAMTGGCTKLCYKGYSRPSFVVPPDDWKSLVFVHGSCRKMHADGQDAMHGIDVELDNTINQGTMTQRPQMLILTGDQIYADDVARPMLQMVIDVGSVVVRPGEKLDGVDALQIKDRRVGEASEITLTAEQLTFELDTRHHLAESCFLSSSEADHHLFLFSEFCAMYLMAWSDVFWPPLVPGEDIRLTYPPYTKKYMSSSTSTNTELTELAHLEMTRPHQWRVRRALANIATYMVSDDHEVTDDWNLTANWCAKIYGSKLGRNLVRNALSASAIFQAWGNSPEQFDTEDTSGAILLNSVIAAVANKDGVTTLAQAQAIEDNVGLPRMEQIFNPIGIFPGGEQSLPSKDTTDVSENMASHLKKGITLAVQPKTLRWSFVLTFGHYQFIMLDTRTRRRYVGSPDADYAHGDMPAQLIDDAQLKAQIVDMGPKDGSVADLTLVVSGGVPLGVPIFEWIQKVLPESKKKDKKKFRDAVFMADVEGWASVPHGFSMLLGMLATRPIGAKDDNATTALERKVVILSGDVHHGYVGRLHYMATEAYGGPKRNTSASFALLTSSAFKNQDLKTLKLEWGGYERAYWINSRNLRSYFGWSNTSGSQISPGLESTTYAMNGTTVYRAWHLKGTPAVGCIEDIAGATRILKNPSEWRYYVELQDGVQQNLNCSSISSRDKEAHAEVAREHQQCTLSYGAAAGPGNQIVGHNNFGLVNFRIPDGRTTAAVMQTLFYSRKDTDPSGALPERTRHIVDLECSTLHDPQVAPFYQPTQSKP